MSHRLDQRSIDPFEQLAYLVEVGLNIVKEMSNSSLMVLADSFCRIMLMQRLGAKIPRKVSIF